MNHLSGQVTEYAAGKLLASVSDGVGLLTFNQPERRNAISVAMWDGLAAILDGWGRDPAVRAAVMTGAGDKAFVSGADISEFGERRGTAAAQREYDAQTRRGWEAMARFSKPLVARIQGFCLGGGLGIAMQADLRVAGEGSSFGIPAARLGIVPTLIRWGALGCVRYHRPLLPLATRIRTTPTGRLIRKTLNTLGCLRTRAPSGSREGIWGETRCGLLV